MSAGPRGRRGLGPGRRRPRAAGWALAGAVLAGAASADPFEIRTLPTALRVVQADLVDLDGDAVGDLVWIGIRDMPPEEERTLHVHYRRKDGSLPEAPDAVRPLPEGVAAYDLADVDGRAGAELLLLRRHHLSVVSMHGGSLEAREIPIPGDPTMAAVHDERGVDRLRIAREGLGRARLLVPGLGHTTLLEADGTPVAELRVGGRANFFVPRRPGPIVAESEMEIYFDHPRISAGDVNGDGRGDLLASDRHALRVFLQDESGGFGSRPQRVLPLRRLAEKDHIRSSGAVRTAPHDFDGDGRVDLLVSSTDGSIFGGTTLVTIHLNRNGGWDLDAPDQRFEVEGGAAAHEIRDLDGDGRAELAQVRIPTGVLELVEVLLTRAIDAEVSIRRPGRERPFEKKPWQTWKLGIGISFETFRSKGFVPALEVDLNGDGMLDLVGSGNGERLEVRLGDREKGYRGRDAQQALDTGGRIRFGDADGDSLPDFVIYDPRRPGSPIRIGRNRGELAGSPPQIRSVEPEGSDRIR